MLTPISGGHFCWSLMQSGWYNRSEDKSTFLSRLPSGSEQNPTWFSRGSDPFLKPARYLSFKELVTFKYQLAPVPVTGPHSVLVSRSPGVSYFSVPEFVNEFTTSKKWFTYCFTPRLLPEQTPHNDSILPGGTFFIQLFSCNLQFVPKATIGRNEWRKSISSVFLPFLCLLIKSFSNFYQRALFDSK